MRIPHVRFLRHLLRTGHWRQGAEIHVARIGRDQFLINGQHTLTAIIAEQRDTWLSIVTIDVDTLNDVARLYETFDRNLHRSLEDIYQSDPTIGGLGWTRLQLKAVSGAVGLLATGCAQEARFADIVLALRDPFVRAELIRDWSPEATRVFTEVRGQLRRTFYRSGVLAVVLATYRYQPDAASTFWPAVCRDSGLTVGMPARALVHFLLATPARLMRGEPYSRHVAVAWNAAYEHRNVDTLVPRAVGNPIRLAGTPHNGMVNLYYVDGQGTVQHRPVEPPPAPPVPPRS